MVSVHLAISIYHGIVKLVIFSDEGGPEADPRPVGSATDMLELYKSKKIKQNANLLLFRLRVRVRKTSLSINMASQSHTCLL